MKNWALMLAVMAATVPGGWSTKPASARNLLKLENNLGADDLFTEAEREAYRKRWIKAGDQGRIQLAEEIGEEGAERLAKQKGWTKLLGKEMKTPGHTQGFDQVWESSDGKIHVVEAKGGGSPLGKGYGYPQGSPEWAVEAAKSTLKSPVATEAEKAVARNVIEAAADGRLEVNTIRTKHVDGKPLKTTMEYLEKSTSKSIELAKEILKNLKAVLFKPAPKSPETPDPNPSQNKQTSESLKVKAAEKALNSTSKLKTLGKVLGGVGVAVDVGIRVNDAVNVEKDFKAGNISNKERMKSHTKNGARMVGGWGCALTGGYGGSMAGAAIGSIFPGPGTAIGGTIGGIVGSIGGYFGGEEAANAAVDACWK